MMSPSDNSSFSPPVRQWSIRQANSRLYSQGLESALESDLTLQQLEEKNNNNNLSHIPMNHLSSTTDNNNNRQSNNPYKSFDTTNMSLHRLDSKGGYSQQHDPFAISPMEAWQEMKDYNLQVHGVPTLDQLLRLPTSNPITQTQFAHFLKRKGAQQNLNFLLELETHQRLWQAYLNSVERQQRPEMKTERTSKFLLDAASINDQSHNLQSQWSPTVPYFETSDTQDLLASLSSSNNNHQQQQNHSYASRTIQGDKSLSRHDLVQNAIRIYRTFCSRLDAAQPIHLPDDHKQCLENLIEQHQRPEPVIFEAARSHVFDVLNMFYYPQFIDAALYTNVSRLTARLYLMAGLILLTLGLALEFAFIFLNAGTTATRWWSFVPFLFSWASLLTGLTHFAWWSAWMKKSEISFMVYIAVEDKTAIRIQRKRAFIWCLANIIIAFINTCIFVFIPAHRL